MEMLGKQIEALGISQTRLPFEFHASVTSEGVGWALWQDNRRKHPLEFGPSSGRRQKPDMHTPKEQQLIVVCTALLLGRKQIGARTPFLSRGGLRTCSMNPPALPWLRLPPCLSDMPLCNRGAPRLPVYRLQKYGYYRPHRARRYSKCPAPVLVAASAVYREWGELPVMPGNRNKPQRPVS